MYDLLRALPATTAVEVRRLGVVGALRRLVEGDLKGAFERVDWEIEPQAERALDETPALVAEVLFFAAREAVRNAARHGRPADKGRGLELAIRIKDQGG